MDTTNSQAVLSAIAAGELEMDLDGIARLVRARQIDARRSTRQITAGRILRELQPGETVRFSNLTHPTYMCGVTAVIQKINTVSASVMITKDQGSFHKGQVVRAPAAFLERIPPAKAAKKGK
jgi:hypothetical protein